MPVSVLPDPEEFQIFDLNWPLFDIRHWINAALAKYKDRLLAWSRRARREVRRTRFLERLYSNSSQMRYLGPDIIRYIAEKR